jgi:inosose dehydratase
MHTSPDLSRRSFLRQTALGSLAATLAAPASSPGAVTKAPRDADHGLKLGIASYSLRKFSLDQAIAMTKEAGVGNICLKDMHLPFKTTREQRLEARQKIESAGLKLLGGGVIYMKNNPEEIRSYFDYARDAGMPTIVCSPELDALDAVEKLAKEYDIRIAIHNHGPGDKNYPSPLDVLKLVQSRDAHMGICMDVGHTVRIGEDPIAVMTACARRLYDFHIKDVTEAAAKGESIAIGRGVIDIVGVLRTFLEIRYPYHVGLEYEDHAEAPMPGICESLGFLRGVLATLP